MIYRYWLVSKYFISLIKSKWHYHLIQTSLEREKKKVQSQAISLEIRSHGSHES